MWQVRGNGGLIKRGLCMVLRYYSLPSAYLPSFWPLDLDLPPLVEALSLRVSRFVSLDVLDLALGEGSGRSGVGS